MSSTDYKISNHFNPDNPEIPSTYGCGFSEFETLRKLMTYVNSLYNAYLELNLAYVEISNGVGPSQIPAELTATINNNVDNILINTNALSKKANTNINANVTDYGAKGDGITDDTQAFRDASITGLPLLVPYTTSFFKLSGTIDLINSIRFDGQVKMFGSIGDDTHRGFSITDNVVGSIIIDNPLIDMGWDNITTTGEQDHAIIIQATNNILIRGGHITNCMGDGIYVGGIDTIPSKNIRIENVVIENVRRCNVALTGTDNVTIIGCTMHSNSDYVSCIDLEPNGTYHCRNTVIRDNTIVNTNGRGIVYVALETGRDIKDISILNNIIDCTGRGIQSVKEQAGRVEIIGNVFKNCSEYIRINAISDELIIERNRFNGCTTLYAISIGTSQGGVKRLTMRNNYFENTTPTDKRNINITQIEYFTFEGNCIDGYCMSTAYINGSLGLSDIKNSIINGNYFVNNGGYAVGYEGDFDSIVFTNNIITPSLTYFTSYTKGANRVGANSIIRNLKSIGNSYSTDLTADYWGVQSGGIIPNNSQEMSRTTTYYMTSIPTVGTYRQGDEIINKLPTNGQPKGWLCISGGTPGTWKTTGVL